MATIHGVIHGKTIELDSEPGLDHGQEVSVEIRPIMREAAQTDQPELPWWLEQLDVDPTVRRGKFVVTGTTLLADALVDRLEARKTDSELLQAHPELTPTPVAALREYAMLPIEMRRSFGAWAEDSEELDG